MAGKHEAISVASINNDEARSILANTIGWALYGGDDPDEPVDVDEGTEAALLEAATAVVTTLLEGTMFERTSVIPGAATTVVILADGHGDIADMLPGVLDGEVEFRPDGKMLVTVDKRYHGRVLERQAEDQAHIERWINEAIARHPMTVTNVWNIADGHDPEDVARRMAEAMPTRGEMRAALESDGPVDDESDLADATADLTSPATLELMIAELPDAADGVPDEDPGWFVGQWVALTDADGSIVSDDEGRPTDYARIVAEPDDDSPLLEVDHCNSPDGTGVIPKQDAVPVVAWNHQVGTAVVWLPSDDPRLPPPPEPATAAPPADPPADGDASPPGPRVGTVEAAIVAVLDANPSEIIGIETLRKRGQALPDRKGQFTEGSYRNGLSKAVKQGWIRRVGVGKYQSIHAPSE